MSYLDSTVTKVGCNYTDCGKRRCADLKIDDGEEPRKGEIGVINRSQLKLSSSLANHASKSHPPNLERSSLEELDL